MPEVHSPHTGKTTRPAIADLVISDMQERKAFGLRKYGVPLHAFNGKDALQEAYEEALDLAVYLRQAIEERNTSNPSA